MGKVMESFMHRKLLLLLCDFLFRTFLGCIPPFLFQRKVGKQNTSSRSEQMMESEIQKSWKLIKDVLEMRLQNQPLHPVQIYAQLLYFACRGKLCEAWKGNRHSLKSCLIFDRTASSIWVLLYLWPERFWPGHSLRGKKAETSQTWSVRREDGAAGQRTSPQVEVPGTMGSDKGWASTYSVMACVLGLSQSCTWSGYPLESQAEGQHLKGEKVELS